MKGRISVSASDKMQENEQLSRILMRNGEVQRMVFVERWIPLEERYLKHFSVLKHADIVL